MSFLSGTEYTNSTTKKDGFVDELEMVIKDLSELKEKCSNTHNTILREVTWKKVRDIKKILGKR